MSNTTTADVDLVGQEMTQNIARVALFAALIGTFAYVSFPNPLTPGIPVTLQVLGVFLAGIFLGPIWGTAALLVYLSAGIMGVPVFSGGSAGLGVIFSTTGGYLLSYPFATFIVGIVVHGGLELQPLSEVSILRLVAGMVIAVPIIYAVGVPVYWYYMNVSWSTAIINAALLFIPAELVKIAAAVGIIRSDLIRAA